MAVYNLFKAATMSRLAALWSISSLVVASSANVFPRQTALANTTATSLLLKTSEASDATPMITPSASLSTSTGGHPCEGVKGQCFSCGFFADNVGLNSWWSSSYNLTVGTLTSLEHTSDRTLTGIATVAVNYVQYNNTLIAANSSTSFVPNATTSLYGTYTPNAATIVLPDVPTTLLDGFANYYPDDYAATAIEAATYAIAGNQTLHSPQAWTQGCGALWFTWTQFIDGKSMTSDVMFVDAPTQVRDLVVFATDAHPTYSASVNVDMPYVYDEVILGGLSTIADLGFTFPASICTGSRMGGEPTGESINGKAYTGTNQAF